MNVYFFDTSAFAKLYAEELGSEEMSEFFALLAPQAGAASDLMRLEMRSTMRRKQSEGRLSQDAADALLQAFNLDFAKLTVVTVAKLALERAEVLIDRHGLKSLDAIQLGSALLLDESSGRTRMTFVSSDRQLLRAAAVEGLELWNPAAFSDS